MTSESSSEQARPHTVWHGHRTPLGTGPIRGGSKLAFFGSHLETAFSGYMSMFSVPGSCLMQVQKLNDGGLVSYRNVWRPLDCKLCRASARCFPLSMPKVKLNDFGDLF